MPRHPVTGENMIHLENFAETRHEQDAQRAHAAHVTAARVIVGASHAYACITGPAFSLDVQLPGGRSASADLERLAAQEREKAARLIAGAERMEAAAAMLRSRSQ